MSEKPIIFSAPMVRSILSGTKTQTRRIIKKRPALDALSVFGPSILMQPGCADLLPCAVGDVLWVREACRADEDMADQKYVEYLADSSRRLLDLAPDDNCSDAFSDWWNLMAYRSNDPGLDGSKPVPSIHMPRWASRITLKVTGVKVERLNDISEDDAKAEGLACLSKDGGRVYKWGIPDRDGLPGNDDDGWHWHMWCVGHKPAFDALWSSLHGPGSWEVNPWVCAITFERVQP